MLLNQIQSYTMYMINRIRRLYVGQEIKDM